MTKAALVTVMIDSKGTLVVEENWVSFAVQILQIRNMSFLINSTLPQVEMTILCEGDLNIG